MKLISHEGKIIIKKMVKEEMTEERSAAEFLKVEQWLNESVALEANKKFGVMLRVHL